MSEKVKKNVNCRSEKFKFRLTGAGPSTLLAISGRSSISNYCFHQTKYIVMPEKVKKNVNDRLKIQKFKGKL